MKPIKNIFIENALTHEDCDIVTSAYLNYIKNGWNGYPHDTYVGISIGEPFKSLGIDDSEIVQRLTHFTKTNFPEEIKYSHSYGRLYRNGAQLWPHTDRETLDITLTINVGGLETWPIHISNIYTEDVVNCKSQDEPIGLKYKENYESFLLPKGSGVICYAHNYTHWREELVCNDDEYVFQIFYHWTIIEK
jgi:hypothetical protein